MIGRFSRLLPRAPRRPQRYVSHVLVAAGGEGWPGRRSAPRARRLRPGRAS
jgi:hypothetical protein